MDSPVRQYRLLPGALPDAQQQAVNRLLPQIAVIAAASLVSVFLIMHSSPSREVPLGWVIFTGAFISYMAFVPLRRARRRLARCWATYVLEIGPDHLLRQQADTPDIRLQFQQVKRIEHLPGRFLRVVGAQRYHVIAIPESIENFPEILQSVTGLALLTLRRDDQRVKTLVCTALGFAVWLTVLWSKSPWVVIPLALLFAGALVWLFAFIQRSPNTSLRSKRFSWLYLLFALASGLRAFEAIGRVLKR